MSREGNWSTYDFVFSKRRIILSAERAEKLVYIYEARATVTLVLAKDLPVPVRSLLDYLTNKM